MDFCQWNLHDKNNDSIIKSFNSDFELDNFIIDEINKNKEYFKNTELDIIPSLDPQQETEEIIKNVIKDAQAGAIEITRLGDDPEEVETYYKIPNSIGVTRFLQEYSPDGSTSPIVTPFNENNWKDKRIEEYVKNGKTQEEAEELVKKEMSSWPIMSEMGEDIHSIFEWVFGGEKEEFPKMKRISDEKVINEAKRQIRDFKKSLEEKYEGCIFHTELPIKSSDLSNDTKAYLEMKGIDSINGKIDLLVVDKNGEGHLYDFKVSRKLVDASIWNQIGDNHARRMIEEGIPDIGMHWWHSTKKQAASHQLALYAAMLRQKGIKVNDANIVPVHTSLTYSGDDQLEVTGINGLEVQYESGKMISTVAGVLGGKYQTTADRIIRNPFILTGDMSTQMQNIYNHFFPKNTTIADREHNRASIEELKTNSKIVQKLKSTDPEYGKGNRWKIIRRGIGKPEYTTDEDLDAKLQDFIEARSSRQSRENEALASEIQAVMAGEQELDLFASNLSVHVRDFIKSQFERYFKNGWSFQRESNLNSMGLFIFTKGDRVEVVAVSGGQPLNTRINLGPSKFDTRYTILGRTKRDRNVNTKVYLQSNIGNMELMRAMTYISLNADKFKGKHIAEVRAINSVLGGEVTASNSQLVKNYNALCSENIDSGAPSVSAGLFLNDIEAYVEGAKDRLLGAGEVLSDYFNSNTMQYNSEWLRTVLESMAKDDRYASKLYDPTQYDENDPVWRAYAYLNKAYTASYGYFINTERDYDDYITKNIFHLDGLKLTSMQYSPSSSIRTLGEVINRFANDVRKKAYDLGWPLVECFENVYKEFGTKPSIFKSLLETDSNGNIDPRLHLKDPNSPDIAGNKSMQTLLDTFLKTMAKLRWGENVSEADIEMYKESGEYYELPLMEARAIDQIRSLNLKTAFKNKIEQYTELTKGIFAGEDVDVEKKALEDRALYNKMALSGLAREQFINEHQVGFFEYDLETIFNNALIAYTKANVSKEYLPLIFGLKIALSHAENYGGNRFGQKDKVSNIVKTFDQLVKSKVYGETIVEGKGMQNALKVVSLIKSAFTTMTLAINVRSFLRESLQGIWTGLSRAGLKMLPGLNEKDYIAGLIHVIQDAHKNLSGVSILQQLNQIYAMANQSLNQVARNRRLNWLNINHWGRDTLFLTATAPDFMHRVSILVGKMMGDGCWEAHTLEDGKLKYDWKKDKRFSIYANQDISNKEYLKQKSLYLTMIDEFNKEGFTNKDGTQLKEGDDLPQAYTSKEAQSIKNYADLLYGHYDDESRSLICDSLFGSLFLQYKTFLTAKLEMWTLSEGIYNTETIKQQKDIFDKDLYEIIRYDEKDENGNPIGMPHRDIITEQEYKELNDEEKSHARLYFDYEGIPMEGMLDEWMSMTKYIVTADEKQLKELWKDPYRRGYFLLGLHDMWIAMFMVWLINVLFGNIYDVDSKKGELYRTTVRKNMRKVDPSGQLIYNVLAGSFQDAQLPNIVSSFTDRPPVITSAKRFVTSSWELMCGNSSLAYWTTNNFGMFRDFQGITKRALEK